MIIVMEIGGGGERVRQRELCARTHSSGNTTLWGSYKPLELVNQPSLGDRADDFPGALP